MGLIQNFRDAISGRRTNAVAQEIGGQMFVNALCSNYENFFAQVQPLINEMILVIPYGVGRNGGALPMARTPELAALMDPNISMGWEEFLSTCVATWLTEDELNIHVHRNGRRVVGYTILPPGCRTIDTATDGYKFYVQTATGLEVLTDADVMTLRFSRSPRNIDKGVSPASAAQTWAQIDDLIAQYQKAFLENGAIPASITTIRASSKELYEETRRDLEKGLKGARNRNKTVYVWRQYLPTGEESDQVEVKTIQGPNSTLALKEINEIITDRLNKVLGVSNFILGDDSSAKFSNAEQSRAQFISQRVYPALRKFWGQFQHELDRITGGLGYGIQFDLEIPELTERKKVEAETAKLNVDNLTTLIKDGASPRAAVAALELSDRWLESARGIQSRVLSAAANVQTNAADQIKTRTANQKAKSSSYDDLESTHSNSPTSCVHQCRHNTTLDAEGYVPVWGDDEKNEKALYDQLMKIVRAVFENADIPEEEVKKAASEILKRVADQGANDGAKMIQGLAYGEAAEEIMKQLENDGYHLSDEFYAKMEDRFVDLVGSLEEEAQQIAADALDHARQQGLTANEIADRLEEVMPRGRAELIARNETANAFRAGRLENDKYLSEEYGIKIGLVWRCHKDKETCPVCEAMDGEVVGLGAAFPEKEIELENGRVMSWSHDKWNDNGQIPNAHVNCRCSFDEEVLDD